ncbi:MAG: hypothetical protein HQ512_05315 [Rhodospirillales bacterium]|nr:hypothetical protein [Rhodospirillales bacterium]
MDDFSTPPGTVPGTVYDARQGTVVIFLSLFLMVLAFFIVLVAISSIEEVKSKAVMNSLSSTFTTYQPTGAKPTDFTAKEGDVLGRQEFQEEVTGVFSTTLQVAKVEIVKPGRLMRARMPTGAMFYEGENRIKPHVVPFLDRMVAALGGRPPGIRFDMEFVIGVPSSKDASEDGALPVQESLEMTRSGAFAREMISRGAPPDSIAIGLAPGDPGQITMRFYARNQKDLRLREFLPQ